MWPLAYPECAPDEVHDKTYDYIIVGGGTAGCVLASRLSEDANVTVLVLEKGYVKDNVVSRAEYSLVGTHSRGEWQANKTIDNGDLGGASRLNAMLLTRGCRTDYIGWAEELGLHDWGWEQVEPHFRKIEHAVDRPDAKHRGHEGPIEARAIKLPFKWGPYIDKAAEDVGLPVSGDCNDPNAPAMGFFHLEAAIDKYGRRISAFKAFMSQKIAQKRRHRLEICTGAVVSRLELDGAAETVSGVHFQSSHKAADPKQFFVKARREVILCAGAICSAQVLLLSGVGPKAQESSRCPDLNIPLVKELPAVGARFSDHYSFPIMLELPKNETFHLLESLWGLWHILLWLLFGKGLMSATSMASTFYVRTGAIDAKTMTVKSREQNGIDNLDTSQPSNAPDVEIMGMPVNSLERNVPGHAFLSLYPTLIQAYATGRVELKSTDPRDHPRVFYPMLSDERDQEAARVAVRFTMRLAAAFQDSDYPYPTSLVFSPGNSPNLLLEWEKSGDEAATTPQPAPAALASATPATVIDNDGQQMKTWKDVTDEEIDNYVKKVGHTSLHFACTCPMSKDEKSGVVDQRLRVYGFKNLRIADASVIPRVPSSHTMLPVMMIAERCAGFIKEAWKEQK